MISEQTKHFTSEKAGVLNQAPKKKVGSKECLISFFLLLGHFHITAADLRVTRSLTTKFHPNDSHDAICEWIIQFWIDPDVFLPSKLNQSFHTSLVMLSRQAPIRLPDTSVSKIMHVSTETVKYLFLQPTLNICS